MIWCDFYDAQVAGNVTTVLFMYTLTNGGVFDQLPAETLADPMNAELFQERVAVGRVAGVWTFRRPDEDMDRHIRWKWTLGLPLLESVFG